MSETSRPSLLVLASTYPRWRGDPEPSFVHELCRRMASHFDIVALVPDAPDAEPSGELDGVKVVRFRYAPRRCQTLVNHGGIVGNLRHHPWKWLLVPGFVLCQYFAARRLIRRRHFDIVHAHWLIPQGLIARQLKKKTNVPYMVTSHGGDLFGLRGPWLEGLKRKVASASSAMTIVSTAMYDEALRIGLRPPQLMVLPMGVDLRERFTIAAGEKRVENELLFVGRLVAKKGLPALFRAMPSILRQRPSTVLTIAGFGPEESSLHALARSLNIEEHINFLGAMSQDKLPELYRRATVFVAPFVRDPSGNQEGLPVVLMEAIGCGCPVIVGNVPGIEDLLGDVAPEVCVDPEDTPALVSSILATLENPVMAQERACRIRHAAEDKIGWDVIAGKYIHTIQQCLQRA